MEQNVDTSASVTPATPRADNEQKSGKGLKFVTAIACVVAICGIGFGVYSKKDKEIATEAETVVDTDADTVNPEDYIYVGEWGVKIKIPDNLQYVSYSVESFSYDDGPAGTTLCVGGATTGHGDSRPSFVGNHSLKPLACVTKNTKSSEGYGWQGSTTVGEYYIEGPQALVGDEADADWEVESVGTLKEMLSTDNMTAI